jgi:UDP-N-acetylglucosamine acyltransferase
MRTRVHPTAIVHAHAELGDGVEVGPYCVVGANVRIGSGTVLHNHVTIQGTCDIGEENVVYPFAVIGSDPQDLKYAGSETSVVIGHRNKIREYATVHRGTELGGGVTRLGSDCLVMVHTHVGHDCTIEDGVVIANNTMLGGHCLVESGAAIGGGAGIHHYTTIGTLAFVGGMSRINKDVPPYVVVEGSPAEPRKINTTALTRRRWPNDEVERLRKAFRALFRKTGGSVSRVLEEIRDEPDQSRAVLRLCDFVERTQAGVKGRSLESSRHNTD